MFEGKSSKFYKTYFVLMTVLPIPHLSNSISSIFSKIADLNRNTIKWKWLVSKNLILETLKKSKNELFLHD
jgi:hypothetical protein